VCNDFMSKNAATKKRVTCGAAGPECVSHLLSAFPPHRLSGEEHLSPEEVSELFDGLYDALKSDAFRNLQRTSRSTVVCVQPSAYTATGCSMPTDRQSGPHSHGAMNHIVHCFLHGQILLRQLFGQAEDQKLLLEVDTMALEDDMLLKVAERMEDECEKTKDSSILPDSQDPEKNLASPDRCDSVDVVQVEARQLRVALAEKDREIEALARAKAELQANLIEALSQVDAATEGANLDVAERKALGGSCTRPIVQRPVAGGVEATGGGTKQFRGIGGVGQGVDSVSHDISDDDDNERDAGDEHKPRSKDTTGGDMEVLAARVHSQRGPW